MCSSALFHLFKIMTGDGLIMGISWSVHVQTHASNTVNYSPVFIFFSSADEPCSAPQSSYSYRRHTNMKAWQAISEQMLQATFSTMIPHTRICWHCRKPCLMKCSYCSVEICDECAQLNHLPLLHKVLQWQVI